MGYAKQATSLQPVGRRFPSLAIIRQIGAGEQQALAGAGHRLVEEGDLVATQLGFKPESSVLQFLPVAFAQKEILALSLGKLALREPQQRHRLERKAARLRDGRDQHPEFRHIHVAGCFN